MIQEPELEEGETFYYKDDASIDPDVDLSYIGDKVQSILGHLQKDFEGGVSAENLGAKFGGYGSFLPMHQRSPSIWSHQNSPPRVQTPHFPKSPNACPESPAPVMPSTQRDDSSSPSLQASCTLKTPFDCAPIGENAILSSGKVAKAFPGKADVPLSKSRNPVDNKALKFRIKVGPERVAEYQSQIHSLGLTSPSSSEGNNHDGLLLNPHETPNESPAYILKVMTTFPVSDGLLLSPLSEDLLNFAKERECSIKRAYKAVPMTSDLSVKLLNNDVSERKKTKFVDRSGSFEKSEDNFIDGQNDQGPLGGDNLECSMKSFQDLNCKSLPEGRYSDKDTLVKKKKGSKDRVKGRAVSGELAKISSLGHTPDECYGKHGQQELRFSSVDKIEEHRARNVSVDHMKDGRSGGKGIHSPPKAYSDHLEGEGVKRSLNGSTVKVGLISTSREHNRLDPHAVGQLSFEGGKKSKESQNSGKKALKAENLRDDDCAAPENKLSVKKDAHRLSRKDVALTSLKHIENPKISLERPSGDVPNDINLDGVKAKSAHADKLKERSSNKKYCKKVSSGTHTVGPPAVAVHSKEGIFSGLEQTVTAPVLIEEEWVGCDRCYKWRLLPYGAKPEQLPKKWVCSMLDWLPGMNRCDISEDDTTAALHASYLVPVPENQHNFHANGITDGGISSSGRVFSQNHHSHASDLIKQQKLKEKQNSVSMNHALTSNGKQKLQRLALRNRSSKDVKLSFLGVNATGKSDVQHTNKSPTVSAKLSKRKGGHVIGDDANRKKKIKESGEYVDGMGEMKRIKSEDALTVDNIQTSRENLHINEQSLKSGSISKEATKNRRKMCVQKDGFSRGPGNAQMYLKKHGDILQDLPDNGPLGMETCNGREVTTKKIKIKDSSYGQHRVETGQENGINEDSQDGDCRRNKKPRVSQVAEEFRRNQDNMSLQRINAEPIVWSSGNKEYPRERSVEKEQQVRQLKGKTNLTIEDIDKLRKDLGCEQLSVVATSSSSKISDSRKNRLSYVEQKGSPEESVSSSPMRMLYPNQVSPLMTETTGKVNFRLKDVAVGCANKFHEMNESSELGAARKGTSGLAIDNGSEILDSKSKLKKDTAVGDNCHSHKHEVSSNMRHSLSYESKLKSARNMASVGKNNLRISNGSRSEKQSTQREHEKKVLKSSHPWDVVPQNLKQDVARSSVKQAQIEPWNGKVRLDLRQGDKPGAIFPRKHASESSRSLEKIPTDSGPYDDSVLGDTSKALKGSAIACLQNGVENYTSNEAEQSVFPNGSLGNKNVSSGAASAILKAGEDVLKEAEELRAHADLIKNSGFSSESNYEYFRAAMKFLLGASLLEAYVGEPSKQLETTPMQMYGAAAQLCKTCAYEYEKSHELAAAALAYKCVEVANMRVVYFKSSSTSRVWQDLQSSLQMVPQGESPSSSASDVDNLNNLAIADKATLSKGTASHAGNHVIVPRNRPNFVRLLDFTKDVNSAMEAAKKSQEAFAAAQIELKKFNKDTIVSIKRVMDFSFQDVEELIRLVSLAFNTINYGGPCGNRE